MDKSSFNGNINNYFNFGLNVGRPEMVNQSASGTIQLLSYNDYYPHGSIIPGRSYSSGSPYRCDYQGKEKDGETGFNNFDLRMYDARLGRWFNPDPMHQYFSSYLAMGNNPVSFIDPSGGYDEDDVMHPPRGPMSTRYMSSQNYINELYRNYGTPEERAERERVGTLAQFGDVELGNGRVAQYDSRGNLVIGSYSTIHNYSIFAVVSTQSGETAYNVTNFKPFVIEGEGSVEYYLSESESNVFNEEAQSSGVVNWNGVNTGLQVAEGFGVVAEAGRKIALDYRMSQPLMSRVGMSANIKTISRLGTASKYLGAAGYGAAGLGTALDINAYNKGQLSGARLSYNMTGTTVGLSVGYFLGPLAGAVASGTFWGAQQMYDGYMYWQQQMSIYLTNCENGFKNGWVPGR